MCISFCYVEENKKLKTQGEIAFFFFENLCQAQKSPILVRNQKWFSSKLSIYSYSIGVHVWANHLRFINVIWSVQCMWYNLQLIRVDEYTYVGMKLTVLVTSLPTFARLWLTQMQVHRGKSASVCLSTKILRSWWASLRPCARNPEEGFCYEGLIAMQLKCSICSIYRYDRRELVSGDVN